MNSTPVIERKSPHNRDAELGLLGAALISPDVLDDVSLIVRPEDFFESAHAAVYRELLAMHEAGKFVDLTVLVARLKKAKQFDDSGERSALPTNALLREIAEAAPVAGNAEWYAKTVRSDAVRREVIRCGMEIAQDAHHADDADSLLASAEAKLFAVGERRVRVEVKPFADLLSTAMDEIDARRQSKTPPGILSGYYDLDQMTAGFRPSQLVIIAGRPHMGKTALATCIAENMLDAGHKLLFVSLEMSSSELVERLLAQRSRVPLMKMLNGTTTPEDRIAMIEAQADLSAVPLTLDDAPGRSVADIAAVARRTKRRQGLDAVFVDYLTQIEPDNGRDPRQEQVAKLSRRLKGLARELNVPVVCVAQLNRDSEKIQRPPRLSDLRESGAIEQDADVVLMVHRPEYYVDKDEDKAAVAGKSELYVRKVRNGKTGVVNLTFFGDFGRFENAASESGYVRRAARSYDPSSPRGTDGPYDFT